VPGYVAAAHAEVYRTHFSAAGSLDCLVGTNAYARATSVPSGSGINFAVWGATVKFDDLIVID